MFFWNTLAFSMIQPKPLACDVLLWQRKPSRAQPLLGSGAADTMLALKGLGVVMKESILRQVDKKSRVPKEEKGVWNSQGGGKDKSFFLHSFVRII